MKPLNEHWNEIFKNTDEDKLGWYEKDFSQVLKFLDIAPEWRNSKIFIPGAGTSGLIDILLKSNAKLVLNDLSSEAIEKAKNKCGEKTGNIQWLCRDISKPLPSELNDVDIWIDRAVLHFLTDDICVEQYFKNVNAAVKSGGHAIFAEFSKTGATGCAGLDVRRYDIRDLEKNLPAFKLIANEEYTFINPKGDPRPYIYALFKKI
ncbi:MAG: class I SAM-dependent methyltransferase [bacterium]